MAEALQYMLNKVLAGGILIITKTVGCEPNHSKPHCASSGIY